MPRRKPQALTLVDGLAWCLTLRTKSRPRMASYLARADVRCGSVFWSMVFWEPPICMAILLPDHCQTDKPISRVRTPKTRASTPRNFIVSSNLEERRDRHSVLSPYRVTHLLECASDSSQNAGFPLLRTIVVVVRLPRLWACYYSGGRRGIFPHGILRPDNTRLVVRIASCQRCPATDFRAFQGLGVSLRALLM